MHRVFCIALCICRHAGACQGHPARKQAGHRGAVKTDWLYRLEAGRAYSEQDTPRPGEQETKKYQAQAAALNMALQPFLLFFF